MDGLNRVINMEEKHLSKEMLDSLRIRVSEKTLPDTIRFTERPLEPLLKIPKGATEEELQVITTENEARSIRNDELARKAKTLKTLLAETAPVP